MGCVDSLKTSHSTFNNYQQKEKEQKKKTKKINIKFIASLNPSLHTAHHPTEN